MTIAPRAETEVTAATWRGGEQSPAILASHPQKQGHHCGDVVPPCGAWLSQNAPSGVVNVTSSFEHRDP